MHFHCGGEWNDGWLVALRGVDLVSVTGTGSLLLRVVSVREAGCTTARRVARSAASRVRVVRGTRADRDAAAQRRHTTVIGGSMGLSRIRGGRAGAPA